MLRGLGVRGEGVLVNTHVVDSGTQLARESRGAERLMLSPASTATPIGAGYLCAGVIRPLSRLTPFLPSAVTLRPARGPEK